MDASDGDQVLPMDVDSLETEGNPEPTPLEDNLVRSDTTPVDTVKTEPDKTEFVTTENDDKTESVVSEETESDPMAGTEDSIKTEEVEVEECILPDENETDDPDDQFIITKISEEKLKECMECEKLEIPLYSCKTGEKNLFICGENCLKALKERKGIQVVIRDLRVKPFAVVDEEENSMQMDDTPNLCNQCKKRTNEDLYFNWNCLSFCSAICLADYQKCLNPKCYQCGGEVPEPFFGKYSVRFGSEIRQFCKNSCLYEYKKLYRFCGVCQAVGNNSYCSVMCYNIGKRVRKHAVCAVCKEGKIQKITYTVGEVIHSFCGEPCYLAYKYVNNVNPTQCSFCKKASDIKKLPIQFSMLDKTHEVCSEECKKLLISTTRRIVHCSYCNVKKYDFDMICVMKGMVFYLICSLNCYEAKKAADASDKEPPKCGFCGQHRVMPIHTKMAEGISKKFCSTGCLANYKKTLQPNPVQKKPATQKVKKIVVVKPLPLPPQRNVATMCKPNMVTKAISCRTKDASKSTQTDPSNNKFLLPIPIPIFVPTPLAKYSLPYPCPFPFPIPIPVPIFIPTTRNSIKGIKKEIERIRNKTPANPLEAEILMMAEMVAEDKQDPTDSESDTETPVVHKTESVPDDEEEAEGEVVVEEQQSKKWSLGEDVIQMALKMATDFDDSEDLEAASTSAQSDDQKPVSGKSVSESYSEIDKPDANMCLKYTFGVNAWKQWVSIKNSELQKSSKKPKLFKSEILNTTADELNYCLCLFVSEVRKPSGSEYAPDTIYYLCLGIQQYLYENGRIDNIFCDPFYDKFTDCLHEVTRKFSLLYNESQYIVTRVEEEHLWECKQLGAHSPLVLLNTLMFFNTKHFGLTTVDEHLQLSFSHIMKHWKRNPSQPGSRNVLLRFYPPQNGDNKPKKKRVYEQQENETNAIRCPVKLYEFYLSKCPESVKTRNDVFYLQPERSCVPDSPVWYSTMAMEYEPLEKMLGRVKMIKEINVAILTT